MCARKDHQTMTWFSFVKGLAEYRQDHYERAVEWMEKVLSAAGTELSRDASAWIVMAMAQHQLKQAGKARDSLAKGREIAATKVLKRGDDDLGDNWVDWIAAHVLLEEASTLIHVAPGAPEE